MWLTLLWIVTPAIDLIEIIAARGNTTLNSTVQLTVSLRNDINDFGKRMSEVMETDPGAALSTADSTKSIIADMKALLARIEDAVPLISLALTTSGANLSASLPTTVSPSRLLQASSFLQAGDAQFEIDNTREMQIGPSFSLKLYTIFEGHSRHSKDPNVSNITWQETYARAILEVIRMPMHADTGHNEIDQRNHKINYLYHFRVTENLDDGRYHEDIISGQSRRDLQGFVRGASRDIPVHNIARLFFSASGRLLNIEEARTPVLVLKINHALKGPFAMVHDIFEGKANREYQSPISTEDVDSRQPSSDSVQMSPDDLEWLALELWSEGDDSNSEGDDFDTASEQSSSAEVEVPPIPATQMGSSRPSTSDTDLDALAMRLQILEVTKPSPLTANLGLGQTSLATLSLLEYILRLSALQTSEQQSIMDVSDERISLFLRDDNAQSRTRSHQEAEGVRRQSTDRFDTPASSIYYEDFIPGTQVKATKSRRSRHVTPDHSSGTPRSSQTNAKSTTKHELDTPANNRKHNSGIPGTLGSRRWQHINNKELNLSPLTSNQTHLIERASNVVNPFQSSGDLRLKGGTNGFSSRLRNSVEGPETSPIDLVQTSPTDADGLFSQANSDDKEDA